MIYRIIYKKTKEKEILEKVSSKTKSTALVYGVFNSDRFRKRRRQRRKQRKGGWGNVRDKIGCAFDPKNAGNRLYS